MDSRQCPDEERADPALNTVCAGIGAHGDACGCLRGGLVLLHVGFALGRTVDVCSDRLMSWSLMNLRTIV